MALGLLLGAEELDHLAGPLVGLGDEHTSRIVPVHHRPDLLEELVGLRLALTVALLGLEEVGDRVETDAVDSEIHPVPDDVQGRLAHGRVLEVEVGLVGEESVEVVLPTHGVERPVGVLGVDEDDADVRILLVGVAPDVEVPVGPLRILSGLLEPLVLV